MDELLVVWWLLAVALLTIWFLMPYLRWRLFVGQPVETQIARTSFQYAPGELAPPAWKSPDVTLSVVIPAYNEEYRLPQMLDETLNYLETRAAAFPDFSYEVIVVDDGSTDDTYAAILSSAHSSRTEGAFGRFGGAVSSLPKRPAPSSQGELRIIRLIGNRGKGFATRVGMLAARGELLLMADADGATRIGDLERLERALVGCYREDGAQIAFGSRHHLRDELAEESTLRSCFTAGFQMLVWLIVGGPIYDTQCGFKLFRADVGKRIFSSSHLYGWAFDVEVLMLARLFGHRIAEVPVTWIAMPGSKLNAAIGAFAMLRDVVLMKALYVFGVWRPFTAY